MKTKHCHLALFLILILISSCENESNKNKGENAPGTQTGNYGTDFPKDSVLEKIMCSSNPSVFYSLYLPPSYSTNKKFPVLFFFDAHGDASLPLNKYKSVASEHGYIFIGSGNSKNGLNLDESLTIATTMMEDVMKNISVDERRIYLAGFSGGARVAGYVAAKNVLVAGVIACSAGIQTSGTAFPKSFSFAGIAGDEDANYQEMKSIQFDMKTVNISNIFFSFHGTHEWPPAETIKKAILWSDFQAMKNKVLPLNDSLITRMQNEYEQKISAFIIENKIPEAYFQMNEELNFLDGLRDMTELINQIASMQTSPPIKKELKEEETIFHEEDLKKQEYNAALLSQSISWWKREILKLKHVSTIDNKHNLLNKRLLGHLGLAVYSYSNNLLRSNQLEMVEKLLAVYQTLEPDNSEAYYLAAMLYARQGKTDASISFLNSAITKGFSDAERISSEPDFQNLKKDSRFISLTSKIKNFKLLNS